MDYIGAGSVKKGSRIAQKLKGPLLVVTAMVIQVIIVAGLVLLWNGCESHTSPDGRR
jgi:hypothetical protein